MTPAADSDSWPGDDDGTSITRSRALVALLTLADDCAEDAEVQRVVCAALAKLQGRRCAPHDWLTPSEGDPGLTCGFCRRFVPFPLSGTIRLGIRQRLGPDHEIVEAIGIAELADRLRRRKEGAS